MSLVKLEVAPVSIIEDLSDHGALCRLGEADHVLWTAHLNHQGEFDIHKRIERVTLTKGNPLLLASVAASADLPEFGAPWRCSGEKTSAGTSQL